MFMAAACSAGTIRFPGSAGALPAGVDIPGYIALVRAGRYNDAVRLIRKDNPFPTVCGYVCEHPCEARCRRSMVDDAVNICGIKRFACDHATDMTPRPVRRPPERALPLSAAVRAVCLRLIFCR